MKLPVTLTGLSAFLLFIAQLGVPSLLSIAGGIFALALVIFIVNVVVKNIKEVLWQ